MRQLPSECASHPNALGEGMLSPSALLIIVFGAYLGTNGVGAAIINTDGERFITFTHITAAREQLSNIRFAVLFISYIKLVWDAIYKTGPSSIL